jgi:hypothetical protein
MLAVWATPGHAQEPDPAAGALALGDRGFRMELADQHDEPVVYPLPRARLNPDGSPPVVLVVWAGRRGAEGRQAWAQALRSRYGEQLDRRASPGLVVLPVAHLGGVPAPLRGLVRSRYFSDRPPVALDWQGETADQLGFVPRVPNLAVLAPDGTLTARLAGNPEPQVRDELFAALDRLLGRTSRQP